MNYLKNQFKQEVESIFNLDFLKYPRVPIDIGEYKPTSFPNERVNHYLIKSNDSKNYFYGDIDYEEIKRLGDITSSAASNLKIGLKDRYCYLTLDQGWVEPKQTLRTAGWHIDGMQGDEVPTKSPGDLTFVWSDCLPTTFATKQFNIEGLNPSIHNVFNWLGKQIKKENILHTKPFRVYAFNPYHVHSASEAQEKIYRRYVRLSYSYIPVTSIKMTVNPAMKYNYKYHTTSGKIPDYLK